MTLVFDGAKLGTEEYKRYIYKGKRGTRDMSLEGYRHAIGPFLIGTDVKSITIVPATIDSVGKQSFETVTDEEPEDRDSGKYSGLWVAVVVAIRVKNGESVEVYESAGEASYRELARKGTADAMIRIAESRAWKRACAKALGITPVSFFGGDTSKRSHMEDTDVPLADLVDDEAAEKRGRSFEWQEKTSGPSIDDIAY